MKSWKYADFDSVNAGHPTGFVDVLLDENLINKTRLTIDYVKTPDGTQVPVEGSIQTLGFLSGTIWRLIDVDATKTDDNNKFRYRVRAVREWNLLSATIYTQMKSAEGFVFVK